MMPGEQRAMVDPPFSTVREALRAASEEKTRGFTFVGSDGEERHYSFAELGGWSRRVAQGLSERGVQRGERVALVIPDNDAFVAAFLGCVEAGVIAVPVYPPPTLRGLDAYLDNLNHILRRAGAVLLVTSDALRPLLGSALAAMHPGGAIVTMRGLERPEGVGSEREVEVGPEDVCFLQFTSGSTSRPKGVKVSHANLVHNCSRIMGEGIQFDSARDLGVIWLPLYHDMGLIGCMIGPLLWRGSVVFMSPMSFIRRPRTWLELLSKHRGTVTFAPNFAYGLVPRRCPQERLQGLDLSNLRVAGCGAEPIQEHTLEAFAEHLAPFGFRREALMPAYGLAEATLAVSFSSCKEPLRAESVDAPTLALGEARQSEAAGSARIVSCGTAFSGHDVAAFDAEGTRLPDGCVGELCVCGPSITAGYHGDDAATEAALRDGWLRTGDLGYLRDGEIYVCGREKEVIIVNGRNFYPHDLELAAGRVAGVRTGNVAAFSVPGELAEQVIVVVESREPERAREIASDVQAAVKRAVDLVPHRVIVLPPGSLPKTSSGKLKRLETRTRLLEGTLDGGGGAILGHARVAREVGRSLFHLARNGFGSTASAPNAD